MPLDLVVARLSMFKDGLLALLHMGVAQGWRILILTLTTRSPFCPVLTAAAIPIIRTLCAQFPVSVMVCWKNFPISFILLKEGRRFAVFYILVFYTGLVPSHLLSWSRHCSNGEHLSAEEQCLIKKKILCLDKIVKVGARRDDASLKV